MWKESGQIKGSYKLTGATKKHVEFEFGDINELATAAEILYENKDVLCAEYLQKQKVFGKFADMGEMASYKSKSKQREPPPEDLEAKEREKEEKKK
jgi:hypothetical protein